MIGTEAKEVRRTDTPRAIPDMLLRRVPQPCFLFVIVLFEFGCTKAASQMSHDRFVEFKSRLGNVIVCPSQWKSEDEGAQWTLTSPDNHALILIWTCTIEGSGSHEDFEQTVLMNLMDDDKRKNSAATTLSINGAPARRIALKSSDTKSGSSFLIFTLRCGELYHALLVQAAPEVMELNGGFYEELVSSFVGITTPP